jgi:hypothetical protein
LNRRDFLSALSIARNIPEVYIREGGKFAAMDLNAGLSSFFMTISEAVHLVLKAGGMGKGGELQEAVRDGIICYCKTLRGTHGPLEKPACVEPFSGHVARTPAV